MRLVPHQAAVTEICNFGKTPLVVAFGQERRNAARAKRVFRRYPLARVVPHLDRTARAERAPCGPSAADTCPALSSGCKMPHAAKTRF